MKSGIHPNYNREAKIICACGHSFTIGSTLDESHVELCSKCHPFFTGKQKLIDTARRVDKYQKRVEAKTMEPSRSKRLKTKKKRGTGRRFGQGRRG